MEQEDRARVRKLVWMREKKQENNREQTLQHAQRSPNERLSIILFDLY